jgi:sulfate adenylyltransferase subunit 2
MAADYLDELESKSIYIIREAYREYGDSLAVLWSMGKDSTTMVHLVRKAFLGAVPLTVMHIDTGFKFREIYDFRDTYAEKWGLRLAVVRNHAAVSAGISPDKGRFECCNLLKTEALRQAIAGRGLAALLVGIRRDEHSIRAKERYFSARDAEFRWDYRDQPLELWTEYYKTRKEESGAHFRIHPLLHWREIDIWRYVKREKLPAVGLYFAKNGKRYRSIGCECCCRPVDSSARTIDRIIAEIRESAVAERSGRAQDKEKEYMMQKLRSLGYM